MVIVIPAPVGTPSVGSGSIALQVQRRSTAAFIAADPLILTLHRKTRVDLPSGGYKWIDDMPIPEQMVRLIPQSDAVEEVSDSNGRKSAPKFVLMANWNADLRQWDTFEHNGNTYQLASQIRPLHSDNAYELKADVVAVETSA